MRKLALSDISPYELLIPNVEVKPVALWHMLMPALCIGHALDWARMNRR